MLTKALCVAAGVMLGTTITVMTTPDRAPVKTVTEPVKVEEIRDKYAYDREYGMCLYQNDPTRSRWSKRSPEPKPRAEVESHCARYADNATTKRYVVIDGYKWSLKRP